MKVPAWEFVVFFGIGIGVGIGCGAVELSSVAGSDQSDGVSSASSLRPASDIALSSVVGIGDSQNLFRNVDDGISFEAADDAATFVRSVAGVSWAGHRVGYQGGPTGTVSDVVVSYRARRSSSARGTAAIELFDGATRLATGPAHALTASWTNFSDHFSGLSVASANNLRTLVSLANPAGAGNLQYTQIWISVTVAGGAGGMGGTGGTGGTGGVGGSGGSASRPIPSPLYGVTTDSISNLDALVESLKSLAYRPTTRVVFDEVPASTYVDALAQIYPISFVMGEMLDSFYMKNWTLDAYKTRADEYFSVLDGKVDIWEIGNEVNGSWNGATADVVAKISYAYDLVKGHGRRAALTLYYNAGCSSASEEMFAWASANVPQRMRDGLDYVLISYYEDDCDGLQPEWPTVFARLGSMFPNAKIGMGECGTTFADRKASYVDRYYGMRISQPQYIGGYFWWYFHQDMVPKTSALWTVLNQAIAAGPVPR